MSLNPDTGSKSTAARSTNFGTLARKIRSRTTDLVAIGIVLIAGLTFGRQVLTWWRADDGQLSPQPPTLPTELSAWGVEGSPVDLQFGDSALGFSRLSLAGSEVEVRQRLLAQCSEKTRTAALPDHPVQPSEQRLLERIVRADPVMKEAGVWEVYLLEQPMPLALGVRFAPRAVGMQGGGVEQGVRRVVCWAWMFPQGKGKFTAYCVQGARNAPAEKADAAELPLPPGSRRLLSVRGAREGAMLSFSGPGPGEKWKEFYDDWGRKLSGEPLAWQRVGAGWSARLRDPSSPREVTWHFSPKSPGPGGTIDWLGLIDLIPIREPRGNP